MVAKELGEYFGSDEGQGAMKIALGKFLMVRMGGDWKGGLGWREEERGRGQVRLGARAGREKREFEQRGERGSLGVEWKTGSMSGEGKEDAEWKGGRKEVRACCGGEKEGKGRA